MRAIEAETFSGCGGLRQIELPKPQPAKDRYRSASRPPASRRSITRSCRVDTLGPRRRWCSATRAPVSSRMLATPVLRFGYRTRCSRCVFNLRMPRSALRRHHTTADFAGLMILRVHVDLPLAGGKLPRVLGSQRGFSLYRRLDRGPFLPAVAGPWKWAMVAGPRQPAIADAPGQHPRRRVIG